jgi:hypothetical protein
VKILGGLALNWHLVWLWTWYGIGVISYWFKRAYYGITPPNPVAHSYRQWLERSWAPLSIRMLLEGVFYWVFFIPGLADKAFAYFGWTSYGWAIALITQVAPVAFFFGHTLDSIGDMLVGVSNDPRVKKYLPNFLCNILQSILPQMPGPLPQEAVVEAQVVRQTTEVTQLQTTTTTVPKEDKP